MTAEVLVMNKMAVALAADSAITIGQGAEQKIYNTGNKLFALSKYHPVGVMVFGNAEFMGVPWETIVKFYRSKLNKQRFDTISNYAADLITFLESENSLFWTSQIQDEWFLATVTNYLQFLVKQIHEQVTAALSQRSPLNDQDIVNVVTQVITQHFDEWEAAPLLSSVSDAYPNLLLEKYGQTIEQVKSAVFQQLPIPSNISAKVTRICGLLFCKNRFPDSVSGIVIAGFGENEIFPSAISYTIEAVISGKLKYVQSEFARADRMSHAIIMPFAQSEMVTTFIEGIDPSYRSALQAYLQEVLVKYPDNILPTIPELDEERRNAISAQLRTVANVLLEDFASKLQAYGSQYHVDPILQAVAALPKDELAAMAESLVNLTSFKRKVSLQAETVGGPIDVAVISKGDGFVWIKRKHYFKPELNQAFFSNYYREF
jgi:hypothetical protein